MGRRNNGLSEQWAVGIMGCRNNGSSKLWAVGIMTRNLWTSVWYIISRRCLLVAVVLWSMWCHTGMPCRRHRTYMTPHPVKVYRHRVYLSCCPLMWHTTLEYTTTHFNVLVQTQWGNPSLIFHTPATLNSTILW